MSNSLPVTITGLANVTKYPNGTVTMEFTAQPDMISDQLAFQLAFGHGVLPYPQIPSERVQERRRMLVTEEYKEFLTAWEACNNVGRMKPDSPVRAKDEPEALAELADSIADAIYVLLGTAFEYGIPIAAVWKAVQEANMSKLWTDEEWNGPVGAHKSVNLGWVAKPVRINNGELRYIVYDKHGKVQKPLPRWKAPDITAIIREAINAKANPEATPPDQQARREEWKRALQTHETEAHASVPPGDKPAADDDNARPLPPQT